MKVTTRSVIACFPLSAILIWSAAAQSDPQASETDAQNAAAQAEMTVRMEQKKDEIVSRAGMSAPMELSEPGEKDFAEEAMENGLIIEVTLEEVEAALNAAKATPEREDDIAAMNLAHWGSYRFFLDDKGASAH